MVQNQASDGTWATPIVRLHGAPVSTPKFCGAKLKIMEMFVLKLLMYIQKTNTRLSIPYRNNNHVRNHKPVNMTQCIVLYSLQKVFASDPEAATILFLALF